ncbi:hypothetical protein PanWU01x14_276200 [Parasponia andersonii]|uniref:Uncharacterized protein n=1 Tax=Parasponia andersonii TaxID=3476 RepID=A0A2P5B332_PARAD|nr:hypothetical protein PanWU01x14_276200 [Parasponia andersonii]
MCRRKEQGGPGRRQGRVDFTWRRESVGKEGKERKRGKRCPPHLTYVDQHVLPGNTWIHTPRNPSLPYMWVPPNSAIPPFNTIVRALLSLQSPTPSLLTII